MALGYDQPLYILPFDHRHSYGEEVFGFHEPLSPEQIAVVAASKQVIYEGYIAAVAAGVPPAKSGILVDEEFGDEILRDARRHGYQFALPVEKSGQHEFDFQYGDEFARHIEAFDPNVRQSASFRYNPAGDQEIGNRRQAGRLNGISELFAHAPTGCSCSSCSFRPSRRSWPRWAAASRPTTEQMRPESDGPGDPRTAGLRRRARHLEDRRPGPAARLRGRGRGGSARRARSGRLHRAGPRRGREEGHRVAGHTAAKVPGFIGFAVGRSSFLDPIVNLQHKKTTRDGGPPRSPAASRNGSPTTTKGSSKKSARQKVSGLSAAAVPQVCGLDIFFSRTRGFV